MGKPQNILLRYNYICYMILVTGGTGLLGAHLLLHLAEEGKLLRSLYRNQDTLKLTRRLFEHYKKDFLFDKIEWVKGDITNVPSLEAAFTGVEYVYHCAAFVTFDPAAEEQLRKVNIEGTANMVNCALAFNVKKFCHVSSIAALGDTKQGETVITEETEWNPERNHNDYAISKYGGEMEVWRAWQEGLNVVIVNPGIIFGYGFWNQGSGAILASVNKGQPFYTRGSCGFVAVEDVVKIMVELMQSEISGERFTLVAENLSYETMLNTVADGMKKKRPGIYASPALTGVAWRIDWLLSKLLIKKRAFTKDMARSSHVRENFDNSKIVKALDYSFTNLQPYIKKLASDFILRQE